MATPPPGFSDAQWAQLLEVPESRLPLPLPDRLTPDDRRLRRAIQAWLQCCVLADRQDKPSLSAPSVETLTAPLNRGKAGLSELPRSYLFGLASRVAQLTYRALWPRTLTGATFTLGVLMLLLRPLWVALPLLADPLRLAATAAVLTWLAPLSWDGAHRTDLAGPGLATTATVLLTIAAVVTVIRLRKADRRWRAVHTVVVNRADRDWTAIVEESWARRRWWIRIGTALAIVTVALAWLGWMSVLGWAGESMADYNLFGWWLPTTVLIATVVTVLSVIVQHAQSAPAPRVPAGRLRTSSRWMAAGLAVAVAMVTVPAWSAWAIDHAVRPDGPLTPTGHTIAAAILLAALLHQGWATRPGLIVAGMLIGASAWALAAWAALWLPPLGTALLAVGAGTAITSAFLQVRNSPVA